MLGISVPSIGIPSSTHSGSWVPLMEAVPRMRIFTGAPVLIDNIFYDFDKATLTEASTTALDQLVTLLKENPHVTIELSAHCDYKGNSEYNKHLSQRRAQSVVDYLIKHGIEKERPAWATSVH